MGKLLGIPREKVIGRPIAEFAQAAFKPQISQLWKALQEQGEDEGKSLAGSGLRRGDDIVAGKRGRNCLGLYGHRLDETMPREISLQNRGQREFSKCIHSKFVKEISEPTSEKEKVCGLTSS